MNGGPITSKVYFKKWTFVMIVFFYLVDEKVILFVEMLSL